MKIAAFLLISSQLLFNCISHDQNKEIPISEIEENIPDQESWNSTIILSDSGKTYAIIQSAHIAKYPGTKEISMDGGVKVDFFEKHTAKHTSVLTSDSAIIDEKTSDLKALGNVSVLSDSGITLRTEELEWKNKDRKIISDAEVTVITNYEIDYGTGFIANEDLTEWEITSAHGHTTIRATMAGREPQVNTGAEHRSGAT